MGSNYLMTVTVPIPTENRLVVIRKGERVEYELDRSYSTEEKNTRVKRRVIGKVDPVQPGRMFPNELYFELFPDNEVPEDVRDEFLRDCAIKRDMGVIRQNPEEIVDRVVEGLDMLSQGREGGDGVERGMGRRGQGNPAHPVGGPASPVPSGPRIGPASSVPTGPPVPAGPGPGYIMVRRVFDEIYFAIEELAGKFPNEVIDPFKVERINEVLEEMRDWTGVERGGPAGTVPSGPRSCAVEDSPHRPTVPSGQNYFRLVEKGLTYSDVLLMLKWYKVLPR